MHGGPVFSFRGFRRKGEVEGECLHRIFGMKHRTMVVRDRMQSGYRYDLTEPEGRNFDVEFRPDLTPKDMLELGVFGGVYLRDGRGEFPRDWFARAKFAPGKRDAKINFFKVNASQSLAVWREKGWIHPDDPRGWFQWYCRYFLGRRHPDDARQIGRWKAMRRHLVQVARSCRSGDFFCPATPTPSAPSLGL